MPKNWEWFSGHWFWPPLWWEFEWQQPWVFYLLLGLGLGLVWRHRYFLRQRFGIEVSSQKHLPPPTRANFLRFVPDALFFLAAFMVITALARPQMSNQRIEQTSEGIDIVLIFDISESMRIEDFSPNRLEAAKKLGVDFIRGRQYDRIGLVLFAGKAYSLAPLTTDYAMLEAYLQSLHPYMIPESGTAIGDALGVATNRLRESNAKSKVMVMISDGDNSAGSLDPLTAAQLAAYYGIKVYAILVGREGTVPMPTKLFGGKKYVENTIDEKTMRQISGTTEGLFFRASDNQALAQIFERINQLEKTEITETRFQITEDYYPVYLRWALIFWLLWLLSKSTFMANVLED